jgi:hypothetical protein
VTRSICSDPVAETRLEGFTQRQMDCLKHDLVLIDDGSSGGEMFGSVLSRRNFVVGIRLPYYVWHCEVQYGKQEENRDARTTCSVHR